MFLKQTLPAEPAPQPLLFTSVYLLELQVDTGTLGWRLLAVSFLAVVVDNT